MVFFRRFIAHPLVFVGVAIAMPLVAITGCGESTYSRGIPNGSGGIGEPIGQTGGRPGAGGSGGTATGTGGNGGATVVATGGSGSGGSSLGSGGRGAASGATGGTGGSGSGGNGTGGRGSGGGVASGGMGSGGRASGGMGTGGMGTGGMGTGGSTASGGNGTGGGTGGSIVGTGGMGSGGNASGGSGTGGASPSGPILYYPFDETSGTTAADLSGNGHTGTVSGGGSFAPGMIQNALTFAGGGSAATNTFVTIPAGPFTNMRDMTVSVWVRIQTDRTWQRIFDIGRSSTNGYMFLTTHAATANVARFAITATGSGAEQRLDGPALPVGTWKHLAVVLGATGGSLYVDGVKVATSAAMMLRAADLGTTTNQWLGRSQFSADPFLAGQLDDFRIYDRALSDAEVAALFAFR